MASIYLRAFLEAQHEVVHDVLKDRVYAGKPRTITELKEAIREDIRAIPRSVCKNVMDNFVLRLRRRNEEETVPN